MKKIILFLFLALLTPSLAFAQTSSTSAEPSPTPAMIEYVLPYPGLLPDNPLYVFKTFRDKLISLFISDPLKKASFDLLQADKRIAAASGLAKEEKGKDALVVTTVSKAENYFDQAISEAKAAKQQGEDINDLWNHMQLASQKHQEVLTEMMGTGSLKTQLNSEEERIKGFEKTLQVGMSK